MPISRFLRSIPILILAAMVCQGFPTLHAQEVDGQQLTKSSLVFDTKGAVAGRTFQIGVLWKMAPKYHLYYKYPGDSGLQPTIKWTLPPGVEIGELRWPVPELHRDRGGSETYIYPDELLLSATVTVPEDFKAERLDVTAEASWLVCDDACYDGSATLKGSLPLAKDPEKAEPDNVELFMFWEQRVPTLTALSSMPLEDFTWAREGTKFVLTLKGLKLAEGALVSFIPTTPSPAVLDHPSPPQVASPDLTIEVPILQIDKSVKELEGILVVDFPKDKVAKGWPKRQAWVLTKLPTSDLGKNGADSGSVADKLAAHPTTPTSGTTSGGPGAGSDAGPGASGAGSTAASKIAAPPLGQEVSLKPAGTPAGSGGGGLAFLYVLWAAFLGGLILNFMPCVLPAISLKIMGFIQDANEHPRRVALMGLAFAAGVFTFFMGLATISSLLTKGTEGLGWGTQFQHPPIVAGMSILMLLFALNLFGLFEVQLPGRVMQGASEAASHGGYGGAFLHGLLATLLATACTAPVMGAALSATLGQPAWFTFSVLAALALGMSSPYLLLALRPQWLRFLPRAGTWMESVKQFMGFLLLATVIWLLWVYAGLTGEDAVYGLLLALLVLSAAIWFIGVARPAARTAGGKRFAAFMFAILLLGSGGVLWRMGDVTGRGNASTSVVSHGGSGLGTATLSESSLGADGKVHWQPWSPALVEQAVAEGRVVFIDFTARWCTNCLANKKLVMDTEPIREAFEKHKVLAVRADWTRRDPETRAAINAYGRVGIPLNVVYGPGLENGQPILLPEILTHANVQEALAKAAGGPKGSAAL